MGGAEVIEIHWCVCGLADYQHSSRCYFGEEEQPHYHYTPLCCPDCPCMSFVEAHRPKKVPGHQLSKPHRYLGRTYSIAFCECGKRYINIRRMILEYHQEHLNDVWLRDNNLLPEGNPP